MDTIVAIATALSNSGIAIIKLSGKDSIKIVNSVFQGPSLLKVKSHTITYGFIKNVHGKKLDEVLISVFRAPKSYTKEDVVEINTHGGNFLVMEIFNLLLLKGARRAEPGEFTKRAFLNGRIDLTKAEAVSDIIFASSEKSLELSRIGLFGKTENDIEILENKLLSLILKAEVNIDYPEYETEEEITNTLILKNVKALLLEFKKIYDYSKSLQIYKNGLDIGIVGLPNVGKSSLLNALLGYEKAIVTSEPGTTRDLVEAETVIKGINVRFIDTAGIRNAASEAEKQGVLKTRNVLKTVDLILVILDGSVALRKEEKLLLEETKNQKRIIVVNKNDLLLKLDCKVLPEHILISTFSLESVEKIKQKIYEYFNLKMLETKDLTYLGSMRQMECLKEAIKSLESVLTGIDKKMPLDFLLVDLKASWVSLGQIRGKNTTEKMLEEMFKNFCLGK